MCFWIANCPEVVFNGGTLKGEGVGRRMRKGVRGL
jgi:hypothetical protein